MMRSTLKRSRTVFDFGALSVAVTKRLMATWYRDRAGNFISMLQDFETWSKYESITLVYSVRTASELAYATRIQEIAETFGEGHTGFKFVPIITVIHMRHCMTAYLY